jgi:excisionase family DNA binding protein
MGYKNVDTTTTPAPEPDFYTPPELAAKLRVPLRTLEKWVLKRRLPVVKVGRLNRFSRTEMQKCFPDFHFPKRLIIYKTYEKSIKTIQHEKCRQATQKLIYERKLIPEPCIICGETKVHAHHNDYSDPLNITWFCRKHHYDFHRKNRLVT